MDLLLIKVAKADRHEGYVEYNSYICDPSAAFDMWFTMTRKLGTDCRVFTMNGTELDPTNGLIHLLSNVYC